MKVSRKEWVLGTTIAAAIALAILSMPEFLEPLARSVVSAAGPLWLLAVLFIGIVHGIKPDEHTWPITVSYAMMQKNLGGVIKAVSVFAGALTIIWTLMSALMGELMGLVDIQVLHPYVNFIVGATMIGVAAYLVFGDNKEENNVKTADYRMIWIHGLAAAFGGDFVIVLVLTAALVPAISSGLGFLVGLVFGLGSWMAQSLIVVFIYKGVIHGVRNWESMAKAGRLALGILGIFMIFLGMVSLFIPF
nr:conserved hypothetical protein [uncultured archaeon]